MYSTYTDFRVIWAILSSPLKYINELNSKAAGMCFHSLWPIVAHKKMTLKKILSNSMKHNSRRETALISLFLYSIKSSCIFFLFSAELRSWGVSLTQSIKMRAELRAHPSRPVSGAQKTPYTTKYESLRWLKPTISQKCTFKTMSAIWTGDQGAVFHSV